MKLHEVGNPKKKEQKISPQLSKEIIARVSFICMKDKSLNINMKSKKLDEGAKVLKAQISKQERYLSKAGELKTQLEKNIAEMDNVNYNARVKLLEMLGSEL